MTKRTPLNKLVAGAAIAALALAACGGEDDDSATTTAAPSTSAAPTTVPATTAAPTTTPTTTAPATTAAPATTEPTDATTTTTAAAAPTTTAGSTPDGEATVVPDDPLIDAWVRPASEFRDQIGSLFVFTCPPGGDVLAVAIWGTEIYTDDSAVCIAGVHVGLITAEEGGQVTILIEEGQDEFAAGTANGVTSVQYGAWPGAFSFPAAPVGSGDFELSLATWDYTLSTFDLEEGEEGTLACAPGGPLGPVWGTGPFTGDSSICTAAVFAGVFEQAEGGAVTIVAGGEVESFESGEANGVITTEYGAYGPTFDIVDTDR